MARAQLRVGLVRAMRGDGGRACGRKAAGAMPDSPSDGDGSLLRNM